MAKDGVKRLPVLGENGKLAGVLARVDVLRLVSEKEARKPAAPPRGSHPCAGCDVLPAFRSFRSRMTWRPLWIRMLEGGSHRVIVVNGKGHAIGLISNLDVVARIQPAEQPDVLAALQGQRKSACQQCDRGKIDVSGCPDRRA